MGWVPRIGTGESPSPQPSPVEGEGGRGDPAPGPRSSGTAGGHVGPPLRSTVEGGSHPHPGPLPSRERGRGAGSASAGTTHAGCDRHTKGWKWLRRRQSELTTVAGDWIPAPYRSTGQAFRRYDGVGRWSSRAPLRRYPMNPQMRRYASDQTMDSATRV